MLALISRPIAQGDLAIVWNVDSVVWIFTFLLGLVRLQILGVCRQIDLGSVYFLTFVATHHLEQLCVSVGDLANIKLARGW